MGNIFRCLLIIIGTLVGAGFASGQEMASFFNRFGSNGLIGVIFSGIFFGAIVFLTLYVVEKKKIEKYEELIFENKFFKFIIELFIYICFCVMVAGCGAFFEQQFGLSFWLGSITCALICYGIFSYKYKGLETLNSILVPFIILGILMIGFGKYDGNAVISADYTIHPGYASNWFISSLIYTSYNSIVLVPIIMSFKQYNLSNKKKIILAILTALSFVIMGLLIYRIIDIYYPNILAYELPNVKLASILGRIQESFYGVVVLTAILTTAVSSGFAFLEMRNTHYDIKAFLICASAVLFAKIGFSELVNTTFPIFGYLGLFQIFSIIVTGFKKDKEGKKDE